MSAYNTVTWPTTCPITKNAVTLTVQFKYGNTWQYQYQLGEELRWGGNEVGKKGKKKVVIDAISERCPACGQQHDLDLFVEKDKLVSIALHQTENDYSLSGLNYIILEE
jgi:hypothetical protein